MHARGGDSTSDNELLMPKQQFELAGHKLRAVRLLEGSQAANLSPEKFNNAVETIYRKVRGASRTSSAWETHMRSFELMLTPPADPMAVDAAAAGLASVRLGKPSWGTGG